MSASLFLGRHLPPVDPARFRHVLGHVPTAVSVVTALTPQGPVGVTVGSFTSVSLEPPLVVFYGGLRSASVSAVVSTGAFCVNVLAEDQESVCAAFAARREDRFESASWEPGAGGAPRLLGALAWIECAVESSFPAGDHTAVVGRVRSLSAAEGSALPLVFCRGRLGSLHSAAFRDVGTRHFDWWSD
ncbi:flavin reductase family protein [Streptomyces sp. YS-B37]|uniref:flavin reductase family protein n=1 Tax=Streptomyces sp. YS-B37 TaxID=3407669 RepID=UPI003B5122E7